MSVDSDAGLNIGNTPLMELDCGAQCRAQLFVKLEQFNPGGSIKDRIAATMIAEAERRGQLRPGMAIIESSSGNTAIGLAMIACRKGYSFYAVCDRNVPAAKLSRIAALGGHIVYLPPTPAGFDTVELRIALADLLAQEIPEAISTSQFSNPDNPLAHEHSTGPEIWRQTGGLVTRVVAAVGTCGTVTGVGGYLKARNPAIEVRAVEPVGSTIFGGTRANFLIQGGGLSFTPAILDRDVVDVSNRVSDAEAIAAIYRFARSQGLLAGGTSGWVLHDLYRLAGVARAGEVIVGILPDGGDRYLDTIYSPAWLQANGFARPAEPASSAFARGASSFGCTIDGYDGTPAGEIVALYRELDLPVPDQLIEPEKMAGRP